MLDHNTQCNGVGPLGGGHEGGGLRKGISTLSPQLSPSPRQDTEKTQPVSQEESSPVAESAMSTWILEVQPVVWYNSCTL